MSSVDPRRPTYRPDLPGVDSTPVVERPVSSADSNQAAGKVILSTTDTPSNSLVLVNLTMVAVGTLKVLIWVAVIGVTVVGVFIGGMIKASSRRRPRYR